MSSELINKQGLQYSAAAAAILAAYYVLPYLLDPYNYRRRFSGPWLASFTNQWMANAAQGAHTEIVRKLHEKYGTFVRIGPNHISIADPEAHEAVYGHASGLIKADFYEVFNSGAPDVFNTTDKAIHTAKRKRVAHIFSMQSVLAFEPRVRKHIQELCDQWDIRCDSAARGISGMNWKAEDGKAIIDGCAQFAFLAFDIIGDLAVGSSFGLVRAQRDAAPMAPSRTVTENAELKTTEIPVASTIVRTGNMVMTVGGYPLWAHKILRLAPWNIAGTIALGRFFKLAVAAVNDRLRRDKTGNYEKDGVDIIDKLLQVRGVDGSGMPQTELISEVMALLIAGGDTTSNTLSGLCYNLAIHPQYQRKLQQELDAHIPLDKSDDPEDIVARYEDIKTLPYLNACIKEIHRFQSVVGTGLPRAVPPGKTFTFRGEIFKAGSVISVPSFTTNRSKIWGHDADEFRPERWLEDGAGAFSKYLVPFSVGARACIGRNLATMDLLLIAATLFRRYESFLELTWTFCSQLHIKEGFVRSTVKCDVSIKRR
ncbi:cytochrome P450 monooxygenase pc-bph [Rhizoctonia solani]|nr:cytochrome P450 monooxygenase pc-bph [Rhizoctonia solani]